MSDRMHLDSCSPRYHAHVSAEPDDRAGRRAHSYQILLLALAAPAIRLHRYRNLRGLMFNHGDRGIGHEDRG